MNDTIPTKLTDEERQEFRDLGNNDAAIDGFESSLVNGLTPNGLTIEQVLVQARATRSNQLQAEAAAKAEQRAYQRAAFAGQALAGLLSNVSPAAAETVAAQSVAYADAVLAELDKTS